MQTFYLITQGVMLTFQILGIIVYVKMGLSPYYAIMSASWRRIHTIMLTGFIIVGALTILLLVNTALHYP